MAERLSFGQRKAVLKCYWKYENSKEVRRQWQKESGTRPLISGINLKPATLNALRETMCSLHTRHTDSRSSLSIDAVWPLMVVTLNAYNDSLSPRKNCNYMSLCSKDIDFQRVSTFFWTALYYKTVNFTEDWLYPQYATQPVEYHVINV
jgi:hypothetical protein